MRIWKVVMESLLVVDTYTFKTPTSSAKTILNSICQSDWTVMSLDSPPEYYLAIVASGISVSGWLGVGGFGLYAAYLLATGGSVYWPALGVFGSFGLGVAFALIEKGLYQTE